MYLNCYCNSVWVTKKSISRLESTKLANKLQVTKQYSCIFFLLFADLKGQMKMVS